MTDMMTLACSTCRITMEQGGGDAASWSILFLLVIIVGVLSCIGYSMVRLARRERANLDPELTDNWSPSEPPN